ncbi:MAG TPA: hypothetical protein PKC49_13210 [Phycisphaerae bacterium]|nr:hypothetical protein [Phycisphaerae bacterium]
MRTVFVCTTLALFALVATANGQSTEAKPEKPVSPAAQNPAAAKPDAPQASGQAADATEPWTDPKIIEKVKNELKAAFDANKSYTCTMIARQFMELGSGNYMESEHIGPVEWYRANNRIHLRQEHDGYSVSSFNGKVDRRTDRALVIVDGEFYYRLTDTEGKLYASKASIIPATYGDPEVLINAMTKAEDVRLLKDEKLEGAECYVFEASPRRVTPLQPAKTLHYFRKDGGFIVLRVGFTANGQEMFRIEAKDVKRNVEIPMERFKFEVPPGVELRDATLPSGG